MRRSGGAGATALVVALVVACGETKHGGPPIGANSSGGPSSGGASAGGTGTPSAGASGSTSISAAGAAGSGSSTSPGSTATTSFGPGTVATIPFNGAGASGQNNLITTGISPDSCDTTAAFNGVTVTSIGVDIITCYYSASVSATVPLAFVQQDEETIGSKDLVHVRLTMNPGFVDNTYGTTAIGWSGGDAGTMGPKAMGHTFWDLVDSDHCEIDFKDSTGSLVLSFNLDYISADTNALSGFTTLGVSGGDGNMLVGDASSVVYYGSSLSRDLNACGYGSYTTNSPATDSTYTANPATPNWDYDVVYDVWVLRSALPSSGWSVSIPYVHASPSKLASTYTVVSAPCPPLRCEGEGCASGGACAGGDCQNDQPDGFGGCVGEGCAGSGQCVGLLCDAGMSTQCVGEGCNDGGNALWCSPVGSVCTDNSACCSESCASGTCSSTDGVPR